MSKRGAAALSIGLGAAILYLGAHAVTGRQGLVAYVGLQEQERVLESRVTSLEAERLSLEARAARLRPGQDFDADYLDERARITLAAGDPDELVFAFDAP
jgi:cell division protein FtsB